MSESVSAVAFDLDGVLVDSEGTWDEIRRGLATEHARRWPDDATQVMQGMSTQEWSGYLVDTVGIPGPASTVAQTVVERMADRYREHVPLLPGAVEAVRRLARRWPLGLASSSPPQLIETVLAVADLTDRFRVTLSTEQVAQGKPSPLVYLAVARQLGVQPQTVVAIEDSSNGLRSASAAGMKLIAVPRPEFPPAADALSRADVVVDSLADVTIELVESLVATS